MAKFEMKTSNLGELYILLKMYGDIYGNVSVGLMEDIACLYKQREKAKEKRYRKYPANHKPTGSRTQE